MSLLERKDGHVADLLLGVDADTPRTAFTTVLTAGATVLLYTDGLVERRSQAIDAGLAEPVTVLHDCVGLSLDDLCDTVLRRMLPSEPDDDVACCGAPEFGLKSIAAARRPDAARFKISLAESTMRGKLPPETHGDY